MSTRVVPITAMAAAVELGGQPGFNLFAMDLYGCLWSLRTGGGSFWNNWDGPKFAGQPVSGAQVAASTQNNRCMMVAMLDGGGKVWTVAETQPGGPYAPWQGPGVAGQKFGFTSLTAGEQLGSGGIQLFAADGDGQIWTLAQSAPGGPWGAWQGPGFHDQPFAAGEVAAAGQNNGNLLLVAEGEGKVAVISQLEPSGGWGEWQHLDPPVALTSLCTTALAGTAGCQIWGIDQTDGSIWTCWQDSPGGAWSAWEGPGFAGQPQGFDLIAAADNAFGETILVATGLDGSNFYTVQTWPGVGNWAAWDWAPPITQWNQPVPEASAEQPACEPPPETA